MKEKRQMYTLILIHITQNIQTDIHGNIYDIDMPGHECRVARAGHIAGLLTAPRADAGAALAHWYTDQMASCTGAEEEAGCFDSALLVR